MVFWRGWERLFKVSLTRPRMVSDILRSLKEKIRGKTWMAIPIRISKILLF